MELFHPLSGSLFLLHISNPKLEWKIDITSPDPTEVKGSFVIDFNETRIHPRVRGIVFFSNHPCGKFA